MVCPQLEFLDIFNLIKEQACDALFQDIIHSFLQIRIQSEVNIISGDRIHPALRINFLPQVVHVYGFAAFFTLKVCFHNLLYPGFTHGIIHFITIRFILSPAGFFIQALELIRGDFTGIAYYMRKISAVDITSDSILCNINSQKSIIVFLYGSYRFFTYIRGNRRGYVFLVAVCLHGIADSNQLKDFGFCIALSGYKGALVIRICPFSDTIGLCHIIDHILGRCVFFLLFQVVNGSMSINISKKTQQLGVCYVKCVFSVFIQVDIKITDNTVAILFNDMNGLKKRGVQIFVFILI